MRVQVDDKIRQECELSYYHTIGVLNEAHEVFYVQHKENHKIYVKKNLYVYNREIYEFIRQINSKYFPQIYECVDGQDHLALIEEYINGKTLEELQKEKGIFSEKEAAFIICELCNALEPLHAHCPPFIHRDIKPSNIMISNEGNVKIIDLNTAKIFHENTTMLMSGWGMQRQQYGEQKHWMLVTLAAMLGQIGTPGGGFGLSYHFANGGNPTRRAAVLGSMQGSVAGGVDAVEKIPVARIVEALENPGAEYQHNGMARRFPDIRFIWWAGGANFTHHQDTNRLIQAWQKPELIVISECFWTAAARHADIVLPATTSFERNDLTMTGDYSNQHLVPMKQVVAPQGEARDDFAVFADLSERWEAGGRERFTEGKSDLQWLETFYQMAARRGAQQQVTLPPFAEFWQANQLIEMPEEPENARFIRFAAFRDDPQANPLKTASGKIEIHSPTIAAFGYADCPPHPMWLEPDEWHGNAEAGQLQLLSAHPAHRLHSQLNHTALRERYAVAGREPVTIHPQDARARGIADGDLVRVWNARGQVLAGAVVTEGIRPGVICLHEGAWPDLDPVAGICKNGAVNVLTKDIPTSRLGNGCAGNTALAWLEKYTGPALPLTAFDPPANA